MDSDVETIEMYCDPDVGMVLDLGWSETGFENFRMVAIDTIGDGNCYFHAITHAFYIPYRTQTLDDRTISRRQIVRDLRDSLSKRLGEPVDPLNPSGPTFYNELSRGKLQEFGREIPEYSFEEMRRRLRSNDAVGNEYNEFISNQLSKDIYILDAHRKDVYITGDDDDLLYKNRPSIVLLYHPGHYELVGIRDSNGSIQTYFSPNHPFIRFVRTRMDQVRSSSRN